MIHHRIANRPASGVFVTEEHAEPTNYSTALVVPAALTTPVELIDLPSGATGSAFMQRMRVLRMAVRGFADLQVQDEANIWRNDEGRQNGLPENVRANHWLLNDSARARRRFVEESMLMYGDIIMTGPSDDDGNTTAICQKLIDYFNSMVLAQRPMAGADVSSLPIAAARDTSPMLSFGLEL